jgi:hypothetical protein
LKSVNVYPNPTNDKLYVAINTMEATDLVIELVSTSGAMVYQKGIKHANGKIYEINVSHCAKGIYYLKIRSEIGQTIEKIVIQ